MHHDILAVPIPCITSPRLSPAYSPYPMHHESQTVPVAYSPYPMRPFHQKWQSPLFPPFITKSGNSHAAAPLGDDSEKTAAIMIRKIIELHSAHIFDLQEGVPVPVPVTRVWGLPKDKKEENGRHPRIVFPNCIPSTCSSCFGLHRPSLSQMPGGDSFVFCCPSALS